VGGGGCWVGVACRCGGPLYARSCLSGLPLSASGEDCLPGSQRLPLSLGPPPPPPPVLIPEPPHGPRQPGAGPGVRPWVHPAL